MPSRMIEMHIHNELVVSAVKIMTGTADALDVAQEAFQASSGGFAERFTAAVEAIAARDAEPEIFIDVPQDAETLSRNELETLVRSAGGFVRSHPTKAELLDDLDQITWRQQRRPEWLPRITPDGQPILSAAGVPEPTSQEVAVLALPEIGVVPVDLPATYLERPTLEPLVGGIGQVELALYRLLRITQRGDWLGALIVDDEANESLVPAEVRWWRSTDDDLKPGSPLDDPAVASEYLATEETIGGNRVLESDEALEPTVRALDAIGFWRHSPQLILNSWEPSDGAELLTAASAAMAGWADETGSGLLVHVGGALLEEHEGVIHAPGPLHSYLLCITRANGSDNIAAVHRLTLSCPGDNWCRRGGCDVADPEVTTALAAYLLLIAQSATIAAVARHHDPRGRYNNLYGPGTEEGIAGNLTDSLLDAAEQAGWERLNRMEIEGGTDEILLRRGDEFLSIVHDAATRQVMLYDGIRDLEMLAELVADTDPGDEKHDLVDEWGAAAIQTVRDIDAERIDPHRDPQFEPHQTTLLGLHPMAWGCTRLQQVEDLCRTQFDHLLHQLAPSAAQG